MIDFIISMLAKLLLILNLTRFYDIDHNIINLDNLISDDSLVGWPLWSLKDIIHNLRDFSNRNAFGFSLR